MSANHQNPNPTRLIVAVARMLDVFNGWISVWIPATIMLHRSDFVLVAASSFTIDRPKETTESCHSKHEQAKARFSSGVQPCSPRHVDQLDEDEHTCTFYHSSEW